MFWFGLVWLRRRNQTTIWKGIEMKICIRFYGEFYTQAFEGYKTLKEVMQDYGISRKSIKEWWKE